MSSERGRPEQVVSDVSYGIPVLELTQWQRAFPTDTPDPADA
jgi:hypothetical protein